MLIVSRKEAKLSGVNKYFTGKPCKYGHVDNRRVHDGACVECQRIAYRKYQEDNKSSERSRKAAGMADLRASRSSEDTKCFNQIHYQKYSSGYKARARARLEGCYQATPAWVDMREIALIYKNCPEGFHVDHVIPLRGKMPDGSKVCGLHVPWNLQYLSAKDNLRKSNKVQLHDLNEIM